MFVDKTQHGHKWITALICFSDVEFFSWNLFSFLDRVFLTVLEFTL